MSTFSTQIQTTFGIFKCQTASHVFTTFTTQRDRQEGPALRLELTDATLTPDPLCSLFVQTADLRSDRDLLQPH